MGCDCDGEKKIRIEKSGGALYGMGVLGAALYFIHTSAGFWAGVLGIVKAFFWPAILVYKVLELIKV